MRRANALKNLEIGDVGLIFQFNVFEFMESMNQEFNLGKEK